MLNQLDGRVIEYQARQKQILAQPSNLNDVAYHHSLLVESNLLPCHIYCQFNDVTILKVMIPKVKRFFSTLSKSWSFLLLPSLAPLLPTSKLQRNTCK